MSDGIVTEFSEQISRLGIQLLNRVISVTASRPTASGTLNYKPLAKWFYGTLDCSEEDFVLALAYLRENHLDFYNKINIPRKWDGGAHLEFPELFMDDEFVELKALKKFKVLTEDGGSINPCESGEVFIAPRKVATMLIRRRLAVKVEDLMH